MGTPPASPLGHFSSLKSSPGIDHSGGSRLGPLILTTGHLLQVASTFSRLLPGQPAPLHHWQSPTRLPLAPATPFVLPLAMPNRCPSTVSPPVACRPGHPPPKTINRKPGDWDSYPPGLYIRLSQNSAISPPSSGVSESAYMGPVGLRRDRSR
jgi:hypothetical protein